MKKILILLAILTITAGAFAQVPRDLKTGYTALRDGKYAEAERVFKKWSSQKSPYQSSALFLLAKAQYRQGKYRESMNAGYLLVTKFPASDYVDDTYFLMGKCAYQEKNYGKATKYWITVLETSHDPVLRKKASSLVANALDYLVTQTEIKKLQNEMDGPIAQAILSIRVAKNEMKEGNYSYAKNILDRYLLTRPQDKYRQLAEELLDQIAEKYEGGKKLGILLPLSGYNEDIGKAILRGLEFANTEMNNQVSFEVYDQNQSMLKIMQTVENLTNKTDVMGMVGPVDNYTAAAVGMISKYTDLPVFSPTASESGIAGLSDFMFQLSPDVDIIASKLALYAMNQMKMDTFAILAPLDDKGMGLAEAFKKTVEESGGHILIEEYYYPESDSYKEQFMRIRRKALFLQVKDTLAPQYPGLTDLQLDSVYKELQEAFYEENPDEDIDSLEIKINKIDGIFIPIYPVDLKKMTAQYAFYNINAALIGNDGWLDRDFLTKNKTYFKEALFCSPYFLNEDEANYKLFKNRFRKTMKTTPEYFDALGFDIGNFLFQKLLQAKSRVDFKNLVSGAAPYDGIGMRIRFSEKPRVNVDVKMIKFRYGQFLNVE